MKLNIEAFQKNFVQVNPMEGINEEDKNAFLKKFYATHFTGNHTEADYIPNSSDIVLFRKQALVMCQHMGDKMPNFSGLSVKFPEDLYISSVLKNIKETMEAICYAIYNHPTRSPDDIIASYKDRIFICPAGTLTNLQSILSDITLGEESLDRIIAQTKYNLMEQIAKDLLSLEDIIDDSMIDNRQGMEIHNVPALVNIIAREYGLIVKTKKEDVSLPENLNPNTCSLMENYVKEMLTDPKIIDSFLDMVVSNIAGMLPEYTKEKYPKKNKYKVIPPFLGLVESRDFCII